MNDQKQTIELLRNLFPDVAHALDRAFEDSGATNEAADFEAKLEVEVDHFQRRHAALAWHEVTDDGARGAVLTSFDRAREALRGSDVELPAPESFMPLVDVALLAEHFETGFAVVPAPHGLGLDGWQQLFQLAAERHPSLISPQEPFIVASEAAREFSVLESAATSPAISGTNVGVRWTLRLIPAGPAPALLGLNYEHGPHVTLPEMLMLQLMRIGAGEEPLDQSSFTWVAGTLSGGNLAARHVYDAADLAVRISCRETGNQGPHLGARVPINLSPKH